MQIKVDFNIPELCSAATFGVVGGVLGYASTLKWMRLGRAAYLAHYAALFDRHTAHPPKLVPVMIAGILMMAIFYAMLKGLAALYGGAFSLLAARRGQGEA